ncbi:12616_t:CDS:2, partial [Entrophospora sp. SA101]
MNCLVTDSAGEYTAASRVSSLAIDVISTFRKSTYFMGQLHTEENMFIYHYIVTQDGIHFFISLVTKLNPEDTFIVNENEVITLPIRICNIIENDSWWCDLRELVRLLHPFCAALNKLQRDKARLDHVLYSFGKIVQMIQEIPLEGFKNQCLYDCKIG